MTCSGSGPDDSSDSPTPSSPTRPLGARAEGSETIERDGSDERPPERIGRFRVEGELGRGGWGVVLAARDERLDRIAALKRLPARWADDPDQRAALEEEARLLASVDHPNVATLYGLEDGPDGTPYLVLELVPGPTLAARLEDGRFSLTEALEIARQLADALEAAHEAGVVHRDLKPANVKVTPVGRVKVLDFGIAQRLSPDAETASDPSLPDPGGVSGSPGYMSPEQVRGLPTDGRTDCWSFGCVLFECLAGVPAFAGATLGDAMAATLHDEPRWEVLPRDLPQRLRSLLARCLSRNVDARPAGFAEIRVELHALQAACEEATMAVPPRAQRLPAPVTSFVGRERELAELEELLEQARLVTLTGVGGTGKSRLALEAARRFVEREGREVRVVELAALAGEELLPHHVLSSLGLIERPGQDAIDLIAASLGTGRCLLVLDNCEHVLTACAALADELSVACPELTLLATSREGLALSGEQVLPVLPLATDTEGARTVAELEQVESVRLFVDRALLVRRDFRLDDENAPAVVSIVRRLDGLPLALELAASRLRHLSVAELDQRLAESYRVLTGSSRRALARHRTLAAAIEWSHELLTGAERVLYRRLSVFPRSWSLEMAERCCGGESLESEDVLDLLSHLVDKSLVVVEDERSSFRYRYLEPVHQHAREKLRASGEADALADRHLAACLAIAEEADALRSGADPTAWLDRLQRERENLLQALAHCAETGAGLSGLRIAWLLREFWHARGPWRETRREIEELLEAAEDVPVRLRAQAASLAGSLSLQEGELVQGREWHERALGAFRDVGDAAGEANSLSSLGRVALNQGDTGRADSLLQRALAMHREAGQPERERIDVNLLGQLALRRGDFERAAAWGERELALAREDANPLETAAALNSLGTVARARGDFEAAHENWERALALQVEAGDRAAAAANLHNLGRLAHAQGNVPAARERLEQALEINREFGRHSFETRNLLALGHLAAEDGDLERADALLAESEEIARQLEELPMAAYASAWRGVVAWQRGARADARSRLDDAVAVFADAGLEGEARQFRMYRALVTEADERDAPATASLGEALQEALAAGHVRAVALGLEAGAMLALATGRPRAGAGLLGAAEAMREGMDSVATWPEGLVDEEAREVARRALGEEDFRAASEQGRTLSPDQAVELALCSRDEPGP